MLQQVIPIKNLFSRREQYTLPGDVSKDLYVIPVSGGADSMALAILMHHLFPEVDFRMIFTDTLADETEIYTSLDKLEAWLGKPIERIVPEKGLYDLIESYGGFIPSGQARYCTRELKLVPFKKWLSGIKEEGRAIYSFIGIRADEATRIAFSDPDIQTELPYIPLEIVREEVFAVLEATVGIPRYYQTRTRSGCHTCPYQRKSEQVGLFLREPKSFGLGMRYEKLAPGDKERFPDNAVPLWKEIGLSSNHLGFALPMRIDIRYREAKPVKWGKVRKTKFRQGIQRDLFQDIYQGVWVGIEFFVNPMLGLFKPTPAGCSGVWRQSLVTYSSTKAGLQQQLDHHYQHRLQTAEVMGLTQDQMREELHYAMYYVALPSDHADTMPLRTGGYTWHQGVSYKQIRHVVGWIKRTLQVAGLNQQIAELEQTNDMWECEQLEDLLMAKSRITEPCGTVEQMDMYVPKEVAIEDQFDERHIPCPMCHI